LIYTGADWASVFQELFFFFSRDYRFIASVAFATFGPSTLSGFHRKLYYLAYTAIVAALLLLGAVWLRVK